MNPSALVQAFSISVIYSSEIHSSIIFHIFPRFIDWIDFHYRKFYSIIFRVCSKLFFNLKKSSFRLPYKRSQWIDEFRRLKALILSVNRIACSKVERSSKIYVSPRRIKMKSNEHNYQILSLSLSDLTPWPERPAWRSGWAREDLREGVEQEDEESP